jgi:hypothetical protein
MAEDRRTRAPRYRVSYAIVLIGCALFVAACFLPYYGLPGVESITFYDQLVVAQDGGLELGAILLLFGGVATVLVSAIVGLTRSDHPSGRAFLAGAVAAWSLSWIGSLLQTANIREDALPEGVSLESGFWLQAVSIGVTVIGTILVGFGKRSHVKDSHDRYATEEGVDAGA